MELSRRCAGPEAPELPKSGSLFARARRFPQLAAFLLLLVFVAQGVLVRSHLHAPGQANALAVRSGTYQIQSTPGAIGDSSADCVLCQEAAMAGAYLLPHLPVLPPPPALELWVDAATLAAFPLLAPSVGWLSRAPPQ